MEHFSFEFLLKEAIYAFYREQNTIPSDLVTKRTIHFELLNRILKELGLPWGFISQLFKTHIHIHPEITKELITTGDEETVSTVVQNFIRNEKIIRILKQMTQHGFNVEELLAVDGLVVNSANKPNFDMKHYIQNLKYAREGPKSHFDEDPEFKRRHCQAVRQMYKVLKDKTKQPSKHVYTTLRHIVKHESNIELPEIEMGGETLDQAVEREIEKAYMLHMDKDLIGDVIKSLRLKGEKRMATDEDMSSRPVE